VSVLLDVEEGVAGNNWLMESFELEWIDHAEHYDTYVVPFINL